MKRGTFRKKTYDEVVKASKLKQEKQNKSRSGFGTKKRTTRRIGGKKGTLKPVSTLKNKLWELCKQITRKKYGNTCYTCGKTGLSGSSQQTGHFIPSSVGGHELRYCLDNLRIQCYRCNIDLSGNGAIFYKLLVEREGQTYVDNIFKKRNKIIKADSLWYQSKIDEYTILLQNLSEKD